MSTLHTWNAAREGAAIRCSVAAAAAAVKKERDSRGENVSVKVEGVRRELKREGEGLLGTGHEEEEEEEELWEALVIKREESKGLLQCEWEERFLPVLKKLQGLYRDMNRAVEAADASVFTRSWKAVQEREKAREVSLFQANSPQRTTQRVAGDVAGSVALSDVRLPRDSRSSHVSDDPPTIAEESESAKAVRDNERGEEREESESVTVEEFPKGMIATAPAFVTRMAEIQEMYGRELVVKSLVAAEVEQVLAFYGLLSSPDARPLPEIHWEVQIAAWAAAVFNEPKEIQRRFDEANAEFGTAFTFD